MSLNIISRGIIFNFVLDCLAILFLIKYSFEFGNQAFSILLIAVLFLISLYVGVSSKRHNEHAQINGLFTGLGSALIIFLFLSQFVDLSWEVNVAILFVWMFIGYLGGFLGSKLTRTKEVQKIDLSVE